MHRALCLLLLAAAAMGESALTVTTHPVLRNGHLFRIEIHSDSIPAFDEAQLFAAIHANGQLLAEDRVVLASERQLHRGLVLHLSPRSQDLPDEVACSLQLTSGGTTLAQYQAIVPTWSGRKRSFAQLQQSLQQTPLPPIAQLWLEQAGLFIDDGPTLHAATQLATRMDLLRSWQRHQREPQAQPGLTVELACRCPFDGSVQPWRVTLPDGRVTAVAVLAHGTDQAVRKHRWPGIDRAWHAQAAAAGIAVCEWYPAGDTRWRGIAQLRLAATMDTQLAQLGLANRPRLLVGSAFGAHAALALASHHAAPLILIEPRLEMLPPQPHTALLGPTADNWLGAVHDPTSTISTLGHRAIALCGSGNQAASTFAAQLAVPPTAFPAETLSDAPWQWALAQLRLAANDRPRDYDIMLPGRYDDVEVTALKQWGAPGFVRVLPGAQVAIETIGIDGCSWHGAQPLAHALPAQSARGSSSAIGLLDGYCHPGDPRGFVVVVGTAEHRAARQRNATLAQRFINDWIEHAHAIPPWCEDVAFDPAPLKLSPIP